MSAARRVAVVGGGFIGTEVAASCRQAGLEVVLLAAEAVPLQRALGAVVGRALAEAHRAHGVDVRTAERVVAFRGNGMLEQVVTASGLVVECDLAVVGVGVTPAVDWLRDSGLALDNGILVDECCRTNLPGVYAAGDAANAWNPRLGQRLRAEHFDNAQHQGVAAARSMLGSVEPYAPVPFFWSDQYDLSIQYVGHADGEDRVVLRGSPASDSWSAFYLRGEQLRAALAVNRPRDLSASRALLAQQISPTPEQLADESCDLKALGRAAAVR
jgi:3-phenylpropionate/trans-cinnamate dioxygenase ferredoxin reductase subunit